MKVNLNLKCEEFKEYLISRTRADQPSIWDNSVLKGVRYRFKFPNGYGASVVKKSGTYGYEDDLWELAVLGPDGDICYDTYITCDVEGFLTDDDVCSLLEKIKGL